MSLWMWASFTQITMMLLWMWFLSLSTPKSSPKPTIFFSHVTHQTPQRQYAWKDEPYLLIHLFHDHFLFFCLYKASIGSFYQDGDGILMGSRWDCDRDLDPMGTGWNRVKNKGSWIVFWLYRDWIWRKSGGDWEEIEIRLDSGIRQKGTGSGWCWDWVEMGSGWDWEGIGTG